MRRAIVVVSLLATSACGASGDDRRGAEPDLKPSSGAERVTVEPPARVESTRVETGSVTVEPPTLDAARIGVQRQEPYGAYLVDDMGYPLYVFTADTPGVRSACTEDCARAWPPVLSAGDPQAGDSAVQTTMLGSIPRSGTEHHATYNGWPLYIYAADLPGRVRGHGVESFGGEWLLIGPDGAPIGPVEVQARR